MTAAQVKFLVSLFLVLAVWRLFEIPGVAAAFWAFCTVGVVPWSDRELGSETVLKLLCIIFAVTFFLIFRKEFMASLPQRAPKADTGPPAPAAQPAAVSPRDKVIVVLKRQQSRPALAPIRPVFILLGLAAAWILQIMTWVEAGCRQAVLYSIKYITLVASYMYRYGSRAAVTACHWLCRAGRIGGRAVRMVWRASEPHIRAFDHWLDVQLHANKTTAEVLRAMGDISKGATTAYHKAQDTKRKLLEDK